MTSHAEDDPPRLTQEGGAAGELLQRVLREPETVRQDIAWRKLQTKVTRGSSAGIGRFALGVLGAAAAVAVLGFWVLPPTNVELGRDPVLARESHLTSAATPAAQAESVAATSKFVSSPAHQHSGNGQSRAAEHTPNNPTTKVNTPANSPAAAGTAAQDPETCAALARAEAYTRAVDCYQRLSEGSTLAAEFALYEKARLESRALGDDTRALRTLDTLVQRFPNGSLGVETTLSQVELLTRSGKHERALNAVERALSGRAGIERKADLLTLKTELLAERGDCAASITTREAALAAGARPERLLLAARCKPQDVPGSEAP